MLSPGTAFLLAYLPARRSAHTARRELARPNASTVQPQLQHALDFMRRALDIENSQVADADARLVELAADAGVSLSSTQSLEQLENAIRALLTSPVLETAWKAGESARKVAISVALLAQVAYLRAAAPDNADLATQAAELATALKDGAAALKRDLEATGLPVVISHAASVQRMIGLVSNLEPTTAGGYRELNELQRDLNNFIEAHAKKLNVAPPPKATSAASPEETALFARIIENPGNSKLRRELSALAEARNDQRGELIRVQLDGGDARREQDLIRSHPEWTAALVELGARDIKFGGGFPEEITIDAETLLARGPQIVAAAPLRRLRVREARGRVADLARLPLLARIETLDLDDQGVTDDDVAALASSPHTAQLRKLDLRHNLMTERGIEAIAASPHLKRLHTLKLDGNPADPVDRQEFYDETNYHYVPTEAGKVLEAKYGALPWLRQV